MTFAVVLPEAQPRRHQSAVRRWRAVNQPHTTGVVSRGRQFPLRLPLASQVTRNTYLNERHRAAKSGSRWERLDDDQLLDMLRLETMSIHVAEAHVGEAGRPPGRGCVLLRSLGLPAVIMNLAPLVSLLADLAA